MSLRVLQTLVGRPLMMVTPLCRVIVPLSSSYRMLATPVTSSTTSPVPPVEVASKESSNGKPAEIAPGVYEGKGVSAICFQAWTVLTIGLWSSYYVCDSIGNWYDEWCSRCLLP
jgi:hypothetical protein